MAKSKNKNIKTSSKRRSQARLKKDKKPKVGVNEFTKDERTHKVLGIFFLLLAAFSFIAFLSYIFTWKSDQGLVMQYGADVLLMKDVYLDNLLGRLGAYVAHVFFYDGIGASSFFLCYLFTLIGVNFISDRRVFNVWRNIRYCLFGIVYISAALALIFLLLLPETQFPWGGGLGDFIANRLMGLIGTIGTVMLWVVIGVAYLVWRYNFSLVPKRGSLKEKAKKVARSYNETIGEDDSEKEVVTQSLGRKEARKELDEKERKKNEELGLKFREKEGKEYDKEGNEIVIDATRKNDPMELSISEKEKELSSKRRKKEERSAEDVELEITPSQEDEKAKKKSLAEKLVRDSGTYEPTLDLQGFHFPPISLLESHGGNKIIHDQGELEKNKRQIVETLSNYKIGIQKISATVGPTVTLYEIVPAKGIRISKIRNLEDDIALSLAALGIRIIAPIPGRGTIGIEVPNEKPNVVSMKTLIQSDQYQNSSMNLPIAIGKKIDNENFVVDLTSMPHLLMAGATGQGKSVGINAILVSLLYKKHPSQLKLVLVDPKKVELSLYRVIEKHYLAKLPDEDEAIITDIKKVVNTLNALCIEMDNRYDLLKNAGARNIKEYNKKFINRKLNPENGHEYLPFIVLVVDEFADLIMTAGKEIEMPIARLAQLARAVGIHLIIATQRPSVNILTGTIKANFPARIAFKVSSKVDSRTILDAGGADQLIGKGDMLISYNGDITRLQCAFVDTPEVEEIVDFISEQQGYPHAFELPEYEDDSGSAGKNGTSREDRDKLFEEAAEVIVQTQQGSTSMLQRRMKLGYNRAGRIMDQLEDAGIVGPNAGSKAREVLIKTEMELNDLLNNEI
ncbi:MAG TPA: DNA translocase FtsK 4TM domain-containing protein [Chitinophagaceae bacterium]|nr:DNA translocase FtsK 4TM domain-containing protein [Chitinophagaceae bacterium]